MRAAWGVIFDMDGVLVDSTEAHYRSWQLTGRKFGVPYPRPLFNHTYGMHNRQSVPLWLKRKVSEKELAQIVDFKEKAYRHLVPTHVRAIPGVISLIQALAAQKVRLAVGSSGPRANVRMALRILKVRKLFQAIACGDDVIHGKPAPDIFLAAARKLKLKPDRCVVVEDAPPGIEAAHRARMRVLAIPTSRSRRELRDADHVAASLRTVGVITLLNLLQRRLRKRI